MRTSVFFAGAVVAALALSIILAPIMAQAAGGFLTIKKAEVEVDDDGIEADLKTKGKIPTNGSGGAFGYGILTAAGTDAVIVTTTHPGVRDSEVQNSKSDPVFHNHFVKLGVGVTGKCPGAEVVDITFQSPGGVEIKGNQAKLEDVPSSLTGTHSLTGDPLTITPDTDVQNVVSFTLDPKFDDSENLLAVCVNDITPAQKLKIESDGDD